jgi:BASS family bile acid:Na+ symporter
MCRRRRDRQRVRHGGQERPHVAGAALASTSRRFTISKLARLDDRQATAISLELGIHNAALAIAVGTSLAPNVTIPAAVYASFMLVTGGGFAWVMAKRNAEPLEDVTLRAPALDQERAL